MRPVHDSNGVYRFVVGVQFEVTGDKNSALKKRLKKLNGLLHLLPKKLEVPSCDLPQAERLDENAGEGLQTLTPPTAIAPSTLLHALCIQQLRPVLDHRSGVPTPLIKLITTAWHHDPKCRPSFPQVLKMLREFDQMNVRQGTENFPSHEARRRLNAQYCSSASPTPTTGGGGVAIDGTAGASTDSADNGLALAGADNMLSALAAQKRELEDGESSGAGSLC
jgi:hypothetical protein